MRKNMGYKLYISGNIIWNVPTSSIAVWAGDFGILRINFIFEIPKKRQKEIKNLIVQNLNFFIWTLALGIRNN